MPAYQSQFVPTDFNTLGNVLGMYRQDMKERNQQFDQASNMEAQTLAELGALQSYDTEGKSQRIGEIQKLMDEAVKKRGGDYGAAAKDITKIIASERSNPWYQFNAKQQEQAKMLDELKARNPNLMVLKDPKKLKYSPNMNLEDISYNVVDPEDIQKSIKDVYGELGNKVREGQLKKSNVSGLLEAETIKGLTDQEYNQMIQDEATKQALLARMPQLQGYMDNPEVGNWFNTQMQQGLKGLVGGSQRQFVGDPNHTSPELAYRMRKDKEETAKSTSYYPLITQSGTGILPESVTELKSRVFSGKANEAAKQLAIKYGIPNINTLQDLEDAAITETPMINPAALASMNDTQRQEWLKKTTPSEKSIQAKNALEEINSKIPTGDFALPTWNFNTLAQASGKSINEVTNLEEGFTKEVQKNKQRFTGISDKDSKNFEKIAKNFRVDDISTDFKEDDTGIFMYVSGLDKDDNPVTARIELNPKETKLEGRLMNFATSLNNDLYNDYQYGKNPKGKIEQAYKELEYAKKVGDNDKYRAIASFIYTKTGDLYGRKLER